MNIGPCVAVCLLGLSAVRPSLSGESNNNWESFGRSASEDHYSPLKEINSDTVKTLGLAWWLDLPPGNSVSAPVEVDGTLYLATGYSVLRAVVAATGQVLWTYDPKAPESAGRKLRQGWGIRGLAYSSGRLYVGTQDGRLIAVDAKTGKLAWSVLTMDPNDVRFISGPPRAFNDKVVIGHGGADVGSIRGYVDCYEARTGKRLWRFYTVPGNPADGFENKAMAMAAKTWHGEWWKYGGGGTVWNSMTYDPDFNVFYLGVGNGAPWNRKIRSAGQGDNLFLRLPWWRWTPIPAPTSGTIKRTLARVGITTRRWTWSWRPSRSTGSRARY